MEIIELSFDKKDIIYDNKVRKSDKGRGKVYLKDKYLGKRVYVFFEYEKVKQDEPKKRKIKIDEILNKGVRSEGQKDSAIHLDKKYVGRQCIIIPIDD